MAASKQSQLEPNDAATCAPGCDDDPERFRERVSRLVKHKPVEKPE